MQGPVLKEKYLSDDAEILKCPTECYEAYVILCTHTPDKQGVF